jgi:hypothetical protein
VGRRRPPASRPIQLKEYLLVSFQSVSNFETGWKGKDYDESVRRLKGAGLIIDELSQNSIDEPGEGPRLYLRGFMTNRNVDHPVIKREHLRYEDVRSTTGADSGSILGPG